MCCGRDLGKRDFRQRNNQSIVSLTRAVSQQTVLSTDESIRLSLSPILERVKESNAIQALKRKIEKLAQGNDDLLVENSVLELTKNL